MMRNAILFVLYLFMVCPVYAGEPTDLSGVYEVQGNLREATISKLEILKVKGQHHIHVWFYGRPDDVDWGSVTATEYKYQPMRNTPDLVAEMQHGDAKAIVIVRVDSSSNEKIHSLNVQSWLSYAHPDEKHQNEAAHDTLLPKK